PTLTHWAPAHFDLSVCPSMSQASPPLRSLAPTLVALPSMSLIPSAPLKLAPCLDHSVAAATSCQVEPTCIPQLRCRLPARCPIAAGSFSAYPVPHREPARPDLLSIFGPSRRGLCLIRHCLVECTS